jgi:SAM-dependent methyltransferase
MHDPLVVSFWAEFLSVLVTKHGRDGRLLDIGCRDVRSGRLLAWAFGNRYYGVDINRECIAAGQTWLRERRLLGHLRTVPPEDFGVSFDLRFDTVVASSMVYHLTDELAGKFFVALARLLKPEGVALANINEHAPEGRWEGLPFVQRPLCFYEGLAARVGLEVEALGTPPELGCVPNPLHPRADRNTIIRVTRGDA